ncbi:MAG: C25 family cysteine peptidase, partial [Bacteroidales bacterium]|nr:C25 family cysteine peptidase [Bacteroidales bacterium]
MRRTFLFLCLVSLAHMFFSQAIKVTYFIQKNDSVDIQLEFKSWVLDSIYRNGKLCIVPRFPHFSTILDSGRPSLSSFHPWLIWDEAFPQIRLISVTDTFFYGGFLPAEKKYLTDYEVASIVSIKDTFKSSDSLYPSDIVKIERRTRAFGQNLVQLGIYPFQYDFVNQKWIFHQKIVFRIANRSIKLKQELPSVLLRNIVLNPFMINKSSHTQIEGYLILTRPTFKFLADSFAMWKTLLGYDVRVVSCPGWTAGSVKDSILAYYFKKDFSLSCVLLLGDVEVIPAVYVQDNQGYYYSDFPYTLLEGDDYFPEVFIGRMPASTVAEARSMIRKVMRYEQNPPLQSSYYQKITLVSHFQDDNNDTYEDRRFSQTIEEIASYLEFLGKGINRIYYADATDDPRYWNNDYFSAGEPVPSHLRKPFFPWNGNYYQIRTAINQGTSLLLYRGHGTINGWSKPSFVRS